MKEIVFSVIMPCYNSQNYVRNAIESIINQTYSNLELVLINDGSDDDTLAIARSYAEKDNRIKIYSKENGGYATAVNMGLDKITGDYFCFIGSDDALDTRLFEQVYNDVCNVNYLPDCIAFRTVKYLDGQPIGNDRYTTYDTLVSSKNTTIKAFIGEYPEYASIFSIRDTSRLFKTSLLKDLRYFGKTGIAADGIFSMLFCHRATSFLCIPYDGYLWNVRADSVSSNVSLVKNIDQMNNWYEFYTELLKMDINDITDKEKEYSSAGLYLVRLIGSDLNNAFKYYRLLKKNAKFFIKVANLLLPGSVAVGAKFVAFSPVLYAIFHKLILLKNKENVV